MVVTILSKTLTALWSWMCLKINFSLGTSRFTKYHRSSLKIQREKCFQSKIVLKRKGSIWNYQFLIIPFVRLTYTANVLTIKTTGTGNCGVLAICSVPINCFQINSLIRIWFPSKKRVSTDFQNWNMTLKNRILQSLKRLLLILGRSDKLAQKIHDTIKTFDLLSEPGERPS